MIPPQILKTVPLFQAFPKHKCLNLQDMHSSPHHLFKTISIVYPLSTVTVTTKYTTIWCTKDCKKKHDLVHEGSHKKARFGARFGARFRARFGAQFGARRIAKKSRIWCTMDFEKNASSRCSQMVGSLVEKAFFDCYSGNGTLKISTLKSLPIWTWMSEDHKNDTTSNLKTVPLFEAFPKRKCLNLQDMHSSPHHLFKQSPL